MIVRVHKKCTTAVEGPNNPRKALEANVKRNSRYLWCFATIMAIFLAITPLLVAQNNSPLEKLPYSGGVLAARAVRAGRLVPQNGGAGLLGPVDLACSPAP